MILLSHKKIKIMPFAATWMDLEIIILVEVNKIKTNIIRHYLNAESKKLYRDFPSGPVVKNPPANGHRMDPWSGKISPACHRATKPVQHNY